MNSEKITVDMKKQSYSAPDPDIVSEEVKVSFYEFVKEVNTVSFSINFICTYRHDLVNI